MIGLCACGAGAYVLYWAQNSVPEGGMPIDLPSGACKIFPQKFGANFFQLDLGLDGDVGPTSPMSFLPVHSGGTVVIKKNCC